MGSWIWNHALRYHIRTTKKTLKEPKQTFANCSISANYVSLSTACNQLYFAGDTLIFHSCIVHKSNANTSDRRRWALLISYNTRENESSIKHHHSAYVPLDVVSKCLYSILYIPHWLAMFSTKISLLWILHLKYMHQFFTVIPLWFLFVNQ